MHTKWFEYKYLVTETMLDIMGHMNHARYLTVFEEARWQLCRDQGFTLEVMQKEGIGFVILDAYVRYQKEVKNRDELVIRTRFSGMETKIWNVEHEMQRADGTVLATGKLKAGLFDLKARKLLSPQPSWLERFQAQGE